MTAPRRLEPSALRQRLKQLDDALREALTKTRRRAALVLQASIVDWLSRAGSGRTYKSRGIASRLARKGTRQRSLQEHRASAPGEPPAPDTGLLRQSVVINDEPDGVRVGPYAEYAAPLEFGASSGGGRQIPRAKAPSVLPNRSLRRKVTTARAQSAPSLGRHLAPRPFMKPALEEAQPLMQDVIVSDLRSTIVTVASR